MGTCSQEPVLTYGERAVRKSFNPSQNTDVAELKTLAAAFIDACERLKAEGKDARALSVAQTNMQQASMWAVFGATS